MARKTYRVENLGVKVFIACECLRCGHVWPGQSEHPTVCPHCHSPYWDKPRKGATHAVD